MKRELFTRGERDTWNGVLEGWGKCNFSVIGTYGDNHDPRIVVNRAEHCINCEFAAIDWNTGKVIKYFGVPNGAVDCIE